MRSKITLLFLLASIFAYSQTVELGFNGGTGATYIVENSDKNININYRTPASISADIKFTPNDSDFGVLLRYQFTGTSVDGNKWFDISNSYFKARVSDNTFSMLLEYLKKNDKKISFGGNFGLAYTKQFISFDNEEYSLSNEFPSIQIGGLINCKLNNKLSLKFQPSFQFFDPINALSDNNYNFAKEDIHFLAQIGVSYRLK